MLCCLGLGDYAPPHKQTVSGYTFPSRLQPAATERQVRRQSQTYTPWRGRIRRRRVRGAAGYFADVLPARSPAFLSPLTKLRGLCNFSSKAPIATVQTTTHFPRTSSLQLCMRSGSRCFNCQPGLKSSSYAQHNDTAAAGVVCRRHTGFDGLPVRQSILSLPPPANSLLPRHLVCTQVVEMFCSFYLSLTSVC